MTAAPPVHLTRLELRHRALALQRRRFWREFSYGAIMVLADILTLSAAFSLLRMLPSDALIPGMGVGGEAFVRGLIPQDAIALGRRVTSLLVCLVVTGSYADTERQAHPARMAAALLLGLLLPRWVEIWQSALPARWLLLGFVLAATWLSLVLQRRALARALRSLDPRRLERARTLIVGPAEDVEGVTRLRDETRDQTATPTFVLSSSWPDGTAESMRELYSALGDSDADAIVLVGVLSDAALQAVMIAASSAGASVYATRRSAFRQLDEPSFVLRRAEPIAVLSRPALVGSQLVVKRLVDLSGAVLGLIVLSPILLAVSLAVRLTSRGPVLFRQVRVGLGGDPFVMLKFRTMKVCDCAESDTHWTTETDGRRTGFGTLLRKTSLDELPQFINVLKGEMSVVGPRPERPHFVQKFLNDITRYNNRHWLKAGITGWAQVNGWRGDTSIQKRLEYDLYYLRNWSFFFDLRIIVLTILSAVVGRNAY